MNPVIAVNRAHPRQEPPVKGFKRRRCGFCNAPVWTARADRALVEAEPDTQYICSECGGTLMRMMKDAGTDVEILQVPGAAADMNDAGRPDLVASDDQLVARMREFLSPGIRS